MPDTSPFDASVPPYSFIRIDKFTKPASTTALHLLTHCHSDHLSGLGAKTFNSIALCSKDTRRIVLNLETYKNRALYAAALLDEKDKHKPYRNLRVRPGKNDGRSRDLLTPLPLDAPYIFEASNGVDMRITPIDANHCPGSVMFLIEGSKGAVLHTGDIRAEPCMIHRLTTHESLKKYLHDEHPATGFEPLEAIYIDTASFFGTGGLPEKRQAISEFLPLLHKYPQNAIFYINAWTWGYEEILQAVVGSFGSPIHVDRYKYGIYRQLSDPILRAAVTEDPTVSTRIHACERFARCEVAADHNNNVVYINPVIMSTAEWATYLSEVSQQIGQGDYPSNLKVAVARHSTMDELQSFVSIFRPKRVVPNTLNPLLQGLDWLAMIAAFSPHIAEGGVERMWNELLATYPDMPKRDSLTPPNIALGVEQDVSLENVVTTLSGPELNVSEPISKRRRRLERLLSLIRGAKTILQKECQVRLPPVQRDSDLAVAYDAEHSSDCDSSESDVESALRNFHRFMAARTPSSPNRSCDSSLKSSKSAENPFRRAENPKFSIEPGAKCPKSQRSPTKGLGPLDLNSILSLDAHGKRNRGDTDDACSIFKLQDHFPASFSSSVRQNSVRPTKRHKTIR